MIPSLEFKSVVDQNKKIHPHKFILWVAIGSIIMMFAGLTSAYIVKREQPGWTSYTTPLAFYYSTAVILISSLTIFLAGKSFTERRMIRYRKLLAATADFGIGFYIITMAGIPPPVGDRHYFTWIRCRSVFVYHCRIARAACIWRCHCPVRIVAQSKKYTDPEL